MMTWRFSNLNSLADYFDNKARELRDEIGIVGAPKSVRNTEKRARAAELESVAYVLRNTILEQQS